jgi:signal transduction histidine kinase
MADRVSGLLASQRAFVADASHQLRTPLTGLRLRIEAAAGTVRDNAVTRDLEAAEREAERLARLVDELLALASSEGPADAGEAELSRAVRQAAGRWADRAGKVGRALELRPGPEIAVAAPAADLAVMLDNLIENALKYSSRGSPVELRWDGRDGAATIAVANRGDPVSAEEAERAFERFYRGAAGRRRAGTGLGLAIVAALARRSGGRARLGNDSGGMVVAEVEIPVAEDEFANS